jgi:enoyl-CoA hydratase/carnithine racemase
VGGLVRSVRPMSDEAPASAAPLVHVERRDDGVAVVRLDNPKVNALSTRLLGQLETAANALSDDPPGAVVVTGGERIFAAGADISEFGGKERARIVTRSFREALDALTAIPRVVIAAVAGYALGGGCELALACDLRVATTRSAFGLPEIKVGIPSVADAALLSQYVGLSLAKEMILTGELYPLARFAASGLCNEIVEPGRLDEAVDGWLTRVAGHTPTATASQKRLFEVWQNTGLATGTAISVQEFASVFAAEETAAQLHAYRRTL